MTQLRAVSLFSNCGAGDLGYRRAGFKFDVMAEIDRRRLQVCLQNHPGAVGIEGDLRDTWKLVVRAFREKAGKNRRPSLLCACPPCQGMSSANPERGIQSDATAGSRDARNLLTTVIVRVAKQLMPAIIVVENVPAFLSRKVIHPRDGRAVSGANFLIASLARDYEPYPLYVDLCEFGIPQSRTRAFLTLIRKDVAGLQMIKRLRSAPFPAPSHSLDGSGKPPIILSEALNKFGLPDLDALTEKKAAAKGYGGLHRVPVWDERTYAMVSAIPPGSGASAWLNQECRGCGVVDVSTTAAVCPLCKEPLLRPIVKARNGRYRLIRGFESSYRRMHADRPAATVTTASGHLGSDYTIHPTQNRLMSMLECALLQTFPLNFKWGKALEDWGHTRVREMIGEAVPPGFTHLHGKVLVEIIRRKQLTKRLGTDDARLQEPWRKLVLASMQDDRGDPRRFATYLSDSKTAPAQTSLRIRLNVRTSKLFQRGNLRQSTSGRST